jgi:transcriptional regulator with XRE-family HTH domain
MTSSLALQQGYGSEFGFVIQADRGGTIGDETIVPAYPIGTGGAATKLQVIAIWRAMTAPFAIVTPDVSVRSAAEQLTVIRHYLSLSVSDLARVAGVQRPTIYSWLQSVTVPRRESLERLALLERVATHWKLLADRPLGALASLAVGANGETFAVLLERASEEQLRSTLGQLAGRLAKRAPSIKAALESRGLPDVSEAELAEGRLRAMRRQTTRRSR